MTTWHLVKPRQYAKLAPVGKTMRLVEKKITLKQKREARLRNTTNQSPASSLARAPWLRKTWGLRLDPCDLILAGTSGRYRTLRTLFNRCSRRSQPFVITTSIPVRDPCNLIWLALSVEIGPSERYFLAPAAGSSHSLPQAQFPVQPNVT
jgi:hypothetical protein